MAYRRRIADAELALRLESAGAVVIEGPKACGKTETARQVAKSEVRLDVDAQARDAAEIAPELLLGRQAPLLIDEWQLAPSLWNHVRRAVDDRRSPGQFILTGSSRPADDASRHSGAGRFSVLRMRPMSLFEAGQSSGSMSLSRLINGDAQTAGDTGLSIARIAELIAVGGWPAEQEKSVTAAARAARDYVQNIAHVDVPSVAGQYRDPARVEALLRSLARNVASEASVTTLTHDLAGSGSLAHRTTVTDYLAVLERLMIVEDQPAWSPAMRSRIPLRRSPKRHFVDPSIALAALNGTSDRLLRDLNTLGLLFESLAVRDLRVLAQPLGGVVHHYRDSKGLEVDAIVQCADGRWGAFEVKLGTSQVDAAAANLTKVVQRIDTEKWGEPSVLGVITATGLGYQRKDGVHVVPIGALGP